MIDYRVRQQRLADRLVAEGYDAAVVVSRGGGTFDRSADVLYLTGHYQNYPYLPGQPPQWSGRSHSVLVINARGATMLVASTADVDDHVLVDQVRTGGDFAPLVAGAIRELTSPGARLAYVGSDTLPDGLAREFRAAVPDAALIDADALVEDQRRRKELVEYDAIRRAASVGRRAVTELLRAIEPGRTEAELVAHAVGSAVGEGAGLYYATISSGPHTARFATAPLPGYSRRTLQSGDLLRFDLVVVVDGYYSDFGRTAVVGEPEARQQHLIDTLHAGLDAAIEAVAVGVPVKDIVAAGDRALRDAGVALDPADAADGLVAAYPPHWGHGLGLGWERPWMTAGEPGTIGEGTYLAIERSVTDPVAGTAAAEQNLLVTADGVEVLTAGPDGPWS